MPRARVRQPHVHGPRVIQALAVGVTLGVILELSRPLTIFYFNTAYFMLPFPIWPLLCFLGPLFILAVLQRHCRHKLWRFTTGAMVFGSMMATLGLFNLQPFTSLGTTFEESLAEAAGGFAVGGSIGGLLNIGLAKIGDLLFGCPLIQDGTLCPTCAYNITHLPKPRCPECGTPFSPTDVEPHLPITRSVWLNFGTKAALYVACWVTIYLAYPYVLIRSAGTWLGNYPHVQYLALRPHHSRSLLLKYIHHEDEDVRAYSAGALFFILSPYYSSLKPDTVALDELAETALSDPAGSVRVMAVSTLACLDKKKHYELLPRLARDQDPEVRWTALAYAASGGSLPNPAGTPWLIQALDDEDVTVRTRCHQRLMANTGQSFPYNASGTKQERQAQQRVWQDWWDQQVTPDEDDN